ncbi:MAG: hypothetical protein OES47_03355 [Acidobacteriota bacterium]|nr:hypothetical protein [Acidobacteriota bacterium]
MSRLAILNPKSLIGNEIKEALERRSELWTDIRLLALETGDYGLLSEVAGEATVVHELSRDNLEGIDLLFACPQATDDPDEILNRLSGVPRTIIASPAAPPPGLPTVIAGVNLDEVLDAMDTGRRPIQLVSPHPGAIALAHLLQPLRHLGLKEAVASVVQPASVHDQAGVDELLEQTRSVLTFSNEFSRAVFGGQLALNLMPTDGSASVMTAARQALGPELALAIHVLQGAVFHSISASVFIRCDPKTSAEEINQALDSSTHIEVDRDAEQLGPIDASGKVSLLASPARAQSGEPGGFWLWAVMDNLTLGASGNALAIAEALLATPQ